ncbi:Tim10/DDP family zinc finger-domain-containing protein [Vararia minispora EC-137]|uniref:Tim10/DDP family zinc finger-domain-containing protein n=1 Tax=Vararia minispora EC-137 TaxID=1314806 RepID=A0ACB8QDE6_9AGAM|nr:Tim10/DDP family zinc finger-domain-containing protein [Vararia minispora EC-137]
METRKQMVMDQIRSELAMAGAQELIQKINDKCFQKCITKPSTSLSNSEQVCLERCLGAYMEAFNIVSRTYTARLAKERLDDPELH